MNENRKRRFPLKRLLLVLLVAALVVGALLVAARKAYSLYNSLVRKVNYTNEVVYAIDEKVQVIRRQLTGEFDHYDFDYSWAAQNPPLIAHALGGIDGNTYTNSLEAFEANYALGRRVFEVDLTFPDTEYTLVAAHTGGDWRSMAGAAPDAVFSYESFMDSTLCGRYTPLDYRGVVDLMAAHPDIYVVTDTKETDYLSVTLQFAQLVKYAQERDARVLDRLIPQIYHEDMLSWVMAVHPFRSVIYTLYQANSTDQEVLDFCRSSGIRFITALVSRMRPDTLSLWKNQGIIVATHTVNAPEKAQALLEQGVDVLYTDFLLPEDIGR